MSSSICIPSVVAKVASYGSTVVVENKRDVLAHDRELGFGVGVCGGGACRGCDQVSDRSLAGLARGAHHLPFTEHVARHPTPPIFD